MYINWGTNLTESRRERFYMTDTFSPGQKVWVLPGRAVFANGAADSIVGRHPGVIRNGPKTDADGVWYGTDAPTLPNLPRGQSWDVHVDKLRPRDEPEAGDWSEVERLTGWNPAKVGA